MRELWKMERILKDGETLNFTKVFYANNGFGAASFGRRNPDVTFFFEDGPELDGDERPYSPFLRKALNPLDMNLMDDVWRDEFIERLESVFAQVPFWYSMYHEYSKCGACAVNLPKLADKALFCNATMSMRGKPCLRVCDPKKATHLFLRFMVDFRRPKRDSERIRQLPSVFYFKPTLDLNDLTEYWVLAVGHSPEEERLRDECVSAWQQRSYNLKSVERQQESRRNRHCFEGRIAAIKARLDAMAERNPEANDKYAFVDGGDYFAFGNQGFACSDEDLNKAELLLQQMCC